MPRHLKKNITKFRSADIIKSSSQMVIHRLKAQALKPDRIPFSLFVFSGSCS